ncbi:hypothetical protein ARSEF4850_007840 [Beauveria asiatica]
MAGHDINLTDDDMWDDSALVESWNGALDEYKKYHSIHVNGSTIRELKALSSASTAEAAPGTQDVATEAPKEAIHSNSHEEISNGVNPEAASAAPAISPAQALLGTVRDDNLRKLLMSWYYAGYYTGLHEGQQQQTQAQQQPH